MSADPEAGAARRNLIVADIVERTGIDRAMIERLVRAFYGRARRDLLIGPIFDQKVTDWEAHIARMCDFWSSVVLMSGRYHGQPMAAHLPLPIDTPHFDRWLELFGGTARDVCPPPAAAHFIDRAQRIANSLQLALAMQRGEIRPRPVRPAKPTLPGNVRPYGKTAMFDQTTMPASLRSGHCTKPGVWGLIRVIDGQLRYRILETGAETILDPEHPGVAQPSQMHEVEPVGPVRFFIEFHSVSSAARDERSNAGDNGATHG